METFIVYIDDKQYALQQVIPMLPASEQTPQAANWILIGCPPRLNRHTGRWLTHTAQKKWRQEWTQETTAELAQKLEGGGNTVSVRVAHGALSELTKQIKGEVGLARVIDARRPKLSVNLDPVTAEQPQEKSTWALPSGVLAMSAAIVMASE
ncbi:hypothetical protein [Limnohabitans sp. Rim11]|jgi:hypothetical protein|uniref:hypothetical protein n=1 Tax=Limnohabitans sp. Rim11 TaxID=1100719 RepID=UPI000AB7F8CB|nr:hypothetical protein [Limnohabitans sp. Rim11]